MTAVLGVAPHAAPVRAAETEPKVVIIVGPTHEATDSYRSKADAAYTVARSYTSNVIKVYSPNATWSKVKSATAGASVVIYFGHGNGWPSPYTYDAEYKTKDGFGLNYDLNGNGKLSDNENKYYGEPYVSQLDLAPNAIILLHHLCYASGNSEPGQDLPSVTTARKRIDNYGAGFLQGPARAVIADGHNGPANYLHAIFTTDQTIEAAWRTVPQTNDNVSSFAGTRSSGATAFMDPEGTGKYYRSLIGDPGLTTTQIRAGMDPSAMAITDWFTDISGSKFVADIDWLFDSGITAGCSLRRFCPTDPVSRGQMASFMARALDLPATSTDYYDDDDGTSHESNINRLAAAGLTNGCGDRRFCPTAVVSRGQMATFLAKALDIAAASEDYFDDDDGTTHEPNINRIAAAGLTSGCGTDRYCPSNAVSRSQMAAFLHRALGSD
jgi:hypothetical protein